MNFSKQSLEEQAADFLRQQILSGELAAGEKLVESSLSKQLELSRTTVRMALNTLASEGLVSQKPYAGWSVVTLSEEDIWEIYHLRVALESQAAQMAAEKIDGDKRAQLLAFFDQYLALCKVEPLDVEKICDYDFKLHQLIVDLSGSGRLAKMYKSVVNQLAIFVRMTHFDFDVANSAESHRSLVEAICDGRVEDAGLLAKENITTFTELGKALKQKLES